MADMREALQVLMVVSMKKALQLTRDQEREVVPKVQRVFDERERYTRVRRDAMRDLQQKLAEESLPEKTYLDVVNRLDDLEKAHRDLEIRLRVEIDRSLNARQQAQMRIFVPRFRRQLQMRIEEARRMRPPHELAVPRAVPPAPEEGPDSEDEEF
jgi:predicted  nucleic acid-binding Zn-ribbon protein